jgi:hypothetical protein
MDALDDKQRLDLTKMIKEYQPEETTDKIRELKHSKQIREQITIMEGLKRKYSRMRTANPTQFRTICEAQCGFLYNKYTNIFNRLYKDELDLGILNQFVTILGQVEDGVLDQHTASYQVGSILKNLYIDSALKNEEHRESSESKSKKSTGKKQKKPKNISWGQFKLTHSMD